MRNGLRLLKNGAAVAGLAAGSGAITSFPTVWAQNIQDVVITNVGQSFSVIPQIAAQATKDLGFKIDMQTVDLNTQMNRLFTQPDSIDIADVSIIVIPDIMKKIGLPIRSPNTNGGISRCRCSLRIRSTARRSTRSSPASVDSRMVKLTVISIIIRG